MLDWIVLLNNVLYWVQWLTTFTIVALIGLGCLLFFVNKKMAIQCGLLAFALFIVAAICGQLGIQLLAPEILALFQNIFK